MYSVLASVDMKEMVCLSFSARIHMVRSMAAPLLVGVMLLAFWMPLMQCSVLMATFMSLFSLFLLFYAVVDSWGPAFCS